MIIITANPRTMYYAWQLEILLTNIFETYEKKYTVHILCGYSLHKTDATNSPEAIKAYGKLQQKYPWVHFFHYPDKRWYQPYHALIKPHLLKFHWRTNPEMQNRPVFLIDADILFLKPIDFEPLLQDDTNYLSDTVSYIGANYIKSKGQHNYDTMVEITGIDRSIPEKEQANSGGGHYLLKNLTWEYWHKVENDSLLMYQYFEQVEPLYQSKGEEDYPLQKWTAEMWGTLWNLWYFGDKVKVIPELKFCMSTDPINYVENNAILHNAGVTDKKKEYLFYKADFINKLPYTTQDKYNPDYVGYHYFQAMKKIDSCLV